MFLRADAGRQEDRYKWLLNPDGLGLSLVPEHTFYSIDHPTNLTGTYLPKVLAKISLILWCKSSAPSAIQRLNRTGQKYLTFVFISLSFHSFNKSRLPFRILIKRKWHAGPTRNSVLSMGLSFVWLCTTFTPFNYTHITYILYLQE